MEYRCKYCGCKVAKYQNTCVNCYKILPLVRELKRIGEEIKAKALGTPRRVIVEKAYYCPHCKMHLTVGAESCGECGQRLSWEE